MFTVYILFKMKKKNRVNNQNEDKKHIVSTRHRFALRLTVRSSCFMCLFLQSQTIKHINYDIGRI